VFSKPTVISWNVNLKLLRAHMLHVVLNVRTVWCNNRLYQLWNVSWTRGLFSVCFGLCSAVVYMFMSHSCHVRRFVELRDIEMLLEVLKFLGPNTAGCCMERLNWFVSLWHREAFIIPMAFVMHHSVVAFTKWIFLMSKKQKEWSQTSNEVETVHCPQRNARHNSPF